MRLIVSVGLSALSLVGCAALPDPRGRSLADNVEETAVELNDAYASSTTSIISLNVLRASYRIPKHYTTLSGIQASPDVGFENTAKLSPLGLGSPSRPFGESTYELKRTDNTAAEYSVQPFANEDRTRNLFEPFQPEIFNRYMQAAWPVEVIFWMFVGSLDLEESKCAVRLEGEMLAKWHSVNSWPEPSDPYLKKNVRCPAQARESAEEAKKKKEDSAEGRANDKKKSSRSAKRHKAFNDFVSLIGSLKKGDYRFVEGTAPRKEGDCLSWDPNAHLSGLLGLTAGRRTLDEVISAAERVTGRKIGMSDNGDLQLCKPVVKKWGVYDGDSLVASVRLRSFDGMIYFLGEYLAENRPPENGCNHVSREDRKDAEILFKVCHEAPEGTHFITRELEVAGKRHFVVISSPTSAKPNRTGTVLGLLSQLYLQSQSDEFLKAPENLVNR